MTREVYTVSLFPRPNVAIEPVSPVRDVLAVCAVSVLCGLYLLIAILVMV